ncbi:MAG TPA: toll/interleukin-1 receptor domain-containing protein [Pyrinomonadaceae bacterium]|nr:toll/interleukin-1 receptor domain-containing protein [Pyrinomonadaceae bacterium]
MKVFISHSQENKALARSVGDALERAGLDVWDEEQEIFPGDNWAEKTAKALEEAQAMVVLLTPEALDSTLVSREIDFALSRERFKNRLIPVLVGLDHSIAMEKLPWILRHLKVIKLPTSDKQEEGINKITQALQAVA